MERVMSLIELELSYISKGSFSEIYSATHNGTKVAVKKYTHEPSVQFINEINALKFLSHPNIIKVLDVRLDKNDVPTVTMEFMERTMDIYVENRKLNDDQRTDMMHQLLSGLHYMHVHDIIHLDIKPPNILVSGKTYKFCDFGSSSNRRCALYKSYTTIWFDSPESLKEESQPDETKQDVWSLGVVFLCVLMGYYVIDARTNDAIVEQQKNLPTPKGKFKNLISRMLDLDQYKRATVEELLKLDIFLQVELPTATRKRPREINHCENYKKFRDIIPSMYSMHHRLVVDLSKLILDNFIGTNIHTDTQLKKYADEAINIAGYISRTAVEQTGDFMTQFEILQALDFNVYGQR
jgi:serine/threonine protein kinase